MCECVRERREKQFDARNRAETHNNAGSLMLLVFFAASLELGFPGRVGKELFRAECEMNCRGGVFCGGD